MYYLRDEERDLPEIEDEDYDRVVAALEDAAENPDLPYHLRREAERTLRRMPQRRLLYSFTSPTLIAQWLEDCARHRGASKTTVKNAGRKAS